MCGPNNGFMSYTLPPAVPAHKQAMLIFLLIFKRHENLQSVRVDEFKVLYMITCALPVKAV